MVRRHSLMELGRIQNKQKIEEAEEDEENNAVAASPLSGDDELPAPEPEEDEAAYLPSPKKRKSTGKKVVTYPIGEGLRSRGDVYPPPDSWSWRKYGQKPIKGSPYPRGYYRCSTSKGCPAKKQVERSRHDPTTLLITYSCDHNHSTTKTKHQQPAPPAVSSPSTSTPTNFSSEECAAFANQTDIEPAASNTFVELAGEYGWLCEVDSTMMNKTTFITPIWTHAEVEVVMPIGEEDELLFGDLGDLPESAVVFRHRRNSCDPVSIHHVLIASLLSSII